MCEDTHHPREAMNLQHIQELKCLHLKPEAGVHQQQYLQNMCVYVGGGGGGGGVCVVCLQVGGGGGGGGVTHFLSGSHTELQDLPSQQSWPHQS